MNFEKPYIIAEIGINHNGSCELAELMCDLALKAGASAVKFQLFDPDELVSKDAEMADYQKKNSSIMESQHKMLSRHKIKFETLEKCRNKCFDHKIDFICTAFDESSLRKVLKLKPDFIKWPSGEIDNLPFLQKACQAELPIIISTGMASSDEVKQAMDLCIKSGLDKTDVILLHCTSQYPTPLEQSNIRSIAYLKETFQTPVGFSDHTMGSVAAQLALAAGAKIFEKHVSLSRLMEGVDHRASATFDELKEYITDLQKASEIMGSFEKKCFSVEAQTKSIARKSLVAKVNIRKGDIIDETNVTAKRPGSGISPKYFDEIVKKRANKDIPIGQALLWADLI